MSYIGNALKAILALAMVVVVVGAGVAIFVFVQRSIPQATASSTPVAQQQVLFVVQPGESVSDVAQNLQDQGIIDSTFWFRLKLKMGGKEGDIKAGSFPLTHSMDMDKVISILTAPIKDEPGIKFQVIEGMRLEEMAEKLSAQGIISVSTFMQMAGTPEGAANYDDDFLKASGKPAELGLEGYLFPDTYEIKQKPGDNSDEVIKTMLQQMEKNITPEMVQTLTAKGRNVHQMLTIAAIVQREGVLKEELPLIASVYWNRVDQGMLLNADPTTQYAVGKPGHWWPVLELDPNTVDNPYNTYKIVGLPPGPICAPGLASIQAAVNPDQSDYLYFVAKNDGTGGHAFATTLEEHERNRVIYGNK